MRVKIGETADACKKVIFPARYELKRETKE